MISPLLGLLSYRSRVMLLPSPKGRWQPWPTLGLRWNTRPKHLLLPRTWETKQNPHIGSGKQRPLRTPKNLGYPPRPHPKLPARRLRLGTRTRFEEMATLSFYSLSRCLILTYLSIKMSFCSHIGVLDTGPQGRKAQRGKGKF